MQNEKVIKIISSILLEHSQLLDAVLECIYSKIARIEYCQPENNYV